MALFEKSRRERTEAAPVDVDRQVDCIDCGEPVPAARLKVEPNARRCVRCLAFIEQSYRREPWT